MSDLPAPLEPANPIHDPVHGRVWLTPVEIAVINTPEFQRLRSIGQLTPVEQVFPGATHNRFAHSIGVVHIMGLILRQPSIHEYFVQRDDRYIQLLRLAALLHDVGHLPFSHVGEMAWNASAPGGDIYDVDRGETVFDAAARARAKPALHEQLSVLLIRASRIAELIDEELGDVHGQPASAVVAGMISGTDPDPVVHNLLSSDLDCDRLDYLLRDSQSAGLVYGHIDLAYLVGNLRVAQDAQGESLLAIDEKHGRLAGEHFLIARYYHYAQFISHKTVAGAEVDLVAAMLELIRLEALPQATNLQAGSEQDRLVALSRLSDQRVLTLVADAPEKFANEDDLVEAAQRIRDRKLLKAAARDERLEEIDRPGGGDRHPWDTMLRPRNNGKANVADQAGVDPTRFCYRRTTMALSGIAGDLAPELAREHDQVEQGVRKAAKVLRPDGSVELLINRSPVLRHLSNHQWATRRIYVREPLDTYQPRTTTETLDRLAGYFDENAPGADD